MKVQGQGTESEYCMTITLSNINDVFKAKVSNVETMELQGFKFINRFFVDSSGFGMPGELALTKDQFLHELKKMLEIHGKLTAKLVGVGQFQVYVGLFIKEKRGLVKRLSPSVFERKEGNKTIVRLYNTDIVTIDGPRVTINNGGFETNTTKKWINKYIGPRFKVFQKDFVWFVHDIQENKNTEYSHNMALYE